MNSDCCSPRFRKALIYDYLPEQTNNLEIEIELCTKPDSNESVGSCIVNLCHLLASANGCMSLPINPHQSDNSRGYSNHRHSLPMPPTVGATATVNTVNTATVASANRDSIRPEEDPALLSFTLVHIVASEFNPRIHKSYPDYERPPPQYPHGLSYDKWTDDLESKFKMLLHTNDMSQFRQILLQIKPAIECDFYLETTKNNDGNDSSFMLGLGNDISNIQSLNNEGSLQLLIEKKQQPNSKETIGNYLLNLWEKLLHTKKHHPEAFMNTIHNLISSIMLRYEWDLSRIEAWNVNDNKQYSPFTSTKWQGK